MSQKCAGTQFKCLSTTHPTVIQLTCVVRFQTAHLKAARTGSFGLGCSVTAGPVCLTAGAAAGANLSQQPSVERQAVLVGQLPRKRCGMGGCFGLFEPL